ncbi:MAG: hypothetical protein ACO3UU_07570 [Minisyncoccia bacterium]
MEPYNNNNKTKPNTLNDIQKRRIDRIISAYKAKILALQSQQEKRKARGL